MASRKSCCVLLLAALALLLCSVDACIFKYGAAPGALKPHKVHYDYSFAGADWDDTMFRVEQNYSSICTSGMQQSPINVPHIDDVYSLPRVGVEHRTTLSLGRLTSDGAGSLYVLNNGHTIQVEWAGAANKPTISVAAPLFGTETAPSGPLNANVLRANHADPNQKFQRLTLNPFQFHFHHHSEHLIGGAMYPLELHIVTQTTPGAVPGCSATLGCLSVVGIMFEVDADSAAADNKFIDTIFKSMPSKDGGQINFPSGTVLNFDDILPGDHTYVTYEGSLTTPPCSEGILWHVLTTPMTISERQYEAFMNATGDEDCTDHSSHHRRKMAETPASGNWTCEKLGAGINYRVVQERKGRNLKAFVDTAAVKTIRLEPLDLDYTMLMLNKNMQHSLAHDIAHVISDKTQVPEDYITINFFPGSVVPEVTIALPRGWARARLDAAETVVKGMKIANDPNIMRPAYRQQLVRPSHDSDLEYNIGDIVLSGAIGFIIGIIILSIIMFIYSKVSNAKKMRTVESPAKPVDA